MHALIVDDYSNRQSHLAIAFMKSGFQTTSTGSWAVADCCIRAGTVDILVMNERIDGRLTHSLSLLAECRNPTVETILITARNDADIDELFLLLPSLHTVVAPCTAPEMITKLAVSAVAGAKSKSEPLMLETAHRILSPEDLSPEETPPPFSTSRPLIEPVLAVSA